MKESDADITDNPNNEFVKAGEAFAENLKETMPSKVEEVFDRPPVVVQNITLTFANGRKGTFMGPALMTTEEFRGMRDINLSHVDVGEPFVIKTDPTVLEKENNA